MTVKINHAISLVGFLIGSKKVAIYQFETSGSGVILTSK